MRARDIFEEATHVGEPLQGHEAQVRQVPGLPPPHRAWLGADGDERPVAYFEIAPGQTSDFSVSQVISVQCVSVQEPSGHGEVSTVKLTCHEVALAVVFYSFVDEILDRASESQDTLQLINGAASEWRSLLLVARSPLTEQAAAGLYGELRFLEDTTRALGPSTVGLWQRTPREIHDFIGDTARVEVKTSAFQNRAAVTIHGLKQLQVPEAATLTLAVAEVQRHGGEHLDDVIERILKLGIERDILAQKLRDARYVMGMPGGSDFSFTLLSWRYWEILPTSTLLSRSTLPDEIANAVSSVSYTLDLSSLGPAQSDFDRRRLKPVDGATPW